jgi:hypothetical protein
MEYTSSRKWSRIAVVAAVVVAAFVAGVWFTSGLRGPEQPLVGSASGPTSSPSAAAESPAVSPSPESSAGPTPTPDAAVEVVPFVCGSATVIKGQQAPPVALISAVRTGSHTSYDRIAIEFKAAGPDSIELTPQNSATFIQDASGAPITLRGSHGLRLVIRGSDAHTAYTGSTDFKTGYPGLLEARETGDFEGVVQWGLGLSQPACYRAFVLTNPTRLVVDVQVM